MEATVYTTKGGEKGKVTLPEAVFGAKWNANLVHDVVVAMQSNARAGTADVKDRGEVRGGGKKPWRQKGTGRARHGSRRSPIWTGGGVTFGPSTDKDYGKKINKNVRAKALASVFSKKHADGEVFFLENLGLSAPKTAEAKGVIDALAKAAGSETLATKKQNAVLVVVPSRDENIERSFQNFGNIFVVQAKDVNPVELLTVKHVVVVSPDETLPLLEKRVATKSARTATVTA